jgi:ATP/maltotriose-dependent transcriptional regulator MalT
LVPALRLEAAQMALSQRKFPEAGIKSSEAIGLAGNGFPDVTIEATFTQGLAKAHSGSGKEALTLCEDAVKMATSAGDAALLSHAMLAQAETELEAGNAQAALNLSTQAQQRFARGSQLESEWRSWIIAAWASQRLGDKKGADDLLVQGRNLSSQLQQKWGAEVFKLYTSRPDIQVYYRELG